ncbi:MAG TPA: TM0106 family RecB-like putative nuclease [Gaiellales bacterium]|nr:TM0106 family RecB-like putative nuclease [Gaiellales bacterium]
MQLRDGHLWLSPSDLSAHLACPYLTRLEFEAARKERSRPHGREELADLVAKKGDEHEAAFLVDLQADGRQVVEIRFDDHDFARAHAATEAAMRAGADVIYQATFARDGWRGRADFLIRVEEPSANLGKWSYEVWDTKLARSAKPAAVLQLTFYSGEVARIQGRLPDRLHVVPGTRIVETFRPNDFTAFLRTAQNRLRRYLDRFPDTYPWPCQHCSRCDYRQVCEARWAADDHLTLVASIRRDHVEKLNGVGVETLEGLADSPPTLTVPRVAPPMLDTLRDQAGLQLHRRRTSELTRHLLEPETERGLALLPPPSLGDLFFDMEGDPFFEAAGGLEFLFGVLARRHDGETEYTAIRARDRKEERAAFERFVDLVHERLCEHPDMHVYHYAAYEPATLSRLMGAHGTREAEVDDLLRREILVDLYQVVRQGLRAGVPSYSLKEIEQFFFTRHADVKSGNDAVLAFERYLENGDESLLTDIEAYNEEDCLATLELRDWLLVQRQDAQAQFGVEIPFRPPPEVRKQQDDMAAELDETARLHEALLLGAEPGDDRWLLAQLLDYHRREARPAWWWFFRRRQMTDEQLLEDGEAVAGLEWDGAEPVVVSKSLEYGFTFPPQQHRFDPGDNGSDPVEGGTGWAVVEVDNIRGVMRLKRGEKQREKRLPTALVPSGPYDTGTQRAALRRLAASVLAADGRYPALGRILRRDLPLGGDRVQRMELDHQRALAVALDRTYLFVQGPPGSGKTYRGARLITALIRAGKRVGVASQSHKAIHNLLDAVEAAAVEEGLTFQGLKRSDEYEGRFIRNGEPEEFTDPEYALIAGTSWLFTREELDQTLDVLVIDEAGQISLADALAMGTSARSVILLGDPLQLAQVSQGVHPPGSGASVLEHLLAEHGTIPVDRGIFLTQTRRMHPAVCAYVSDAFYEGRLDAIPQCAERSTSLGVGIRWLSVEHDGDRVESVQEADAVAREIARVLAGTFTDATGSRPLRTSDVMVVAPYNAQVRLLTERLPAGVEIGTVDKFQGREAPVVFYSMTTSSGEDVPHGLEFLFSRHRLNVAISRAQCLAYLVCSPGLLEVNCQTIEQMRLANALCRFAELAGAAGSAEAGPA